MFSRINCLLSTSLTTSIYGLLFWKIKIHSLVSIFNGLTVPMVCIVSNMHYYTNVVESVFVIVLRDEYFSVAQDSCLVWTLVFPVP